MTSHQRIRKAVFPAAGLGTRFLPATKAQPKEMLPLVDKPIIQYVIEEAVAAGLTNIIIVTGRGKNAIEDHFDVSYELEKLLQREDVWALVAQSATALMDGEKEKAREIAGRAVEFLRETTRLMGLHTDVVITDQEPGEISIEIRGEGLGVLVGRQGARVVSHG